MIMIEAEKHDMHHASSPTKESHAGFKASPQGFQAKKKHYNLIFRTT